VKSFGERKHKFSKATQYTLTELRYIDILRKFYFSCIQRERKSSF